jgi:glycosyltransferase involved in cell wall biosynthesis
MGVTILIPCKNEELTIRDVILDCEHELPSAKIVVGDNNCTDRTREIAERLGVRVIDCKAPGKGNALKTMLQELLPENDPEECYVWMDGDGTYAAWDAARLVESMGQDDIMAIGDRRPEYYERHPSLLHAIGNKIVPWLVQKRLSAPSLDVMSGLRVIRGSFFLEYPIQSDGFTVETEVTMNLIRSKKPYLQKEISYKDRPKGSHTKIHSLFDGGKIILWILTH